MCAPLLVLIRMQSPALHATIGHVALRLLHLDMLGVRQDARALNHTKI